METCEPRHVGERARKGGRACACESIHADKIDKKGKFKPGISFCRQGHVGQLSDVSNVNDVSDVSDVSHLGPVSDVSNDVSDGFIDDVSIEVIMKAIM